MNPDVAGEDYQHGALYRTNLRGFVYTRDGRRCVYCGAGKELTLDHVRCRSNGGADRHWNVVAACRRSNEEKDDQELGAWLAKTGRNAVRERAEKTLRYVARLRTGQVALRALAAANIVAPRIAERLEAEGKLRGETQDG